MDLIRRFDDTAYHRALAEWAWLLDGTQLRPIAASMFADIFFLGPDGGWYLDLVAGSLTKEWSDGATLQAALNTADGQDNYLMAGLVSAAHERGLVPGREQVFDFTVPPVLGGELSAENLGVRDFVLACSLAGQLHRQVKDLPPGTPISGFIVEE